MSKSIEITFKWSKELALKASKLYYDYDMKNSSKRYIGWLFIALMQFGVVGALKHDAFGLLYISTFFVLYWYYGRWYLRKRIILNYYEKSNLDNKEAKFVLKDDGLHFENSLIDWDSISKVVKFDDGILVQTTQETLFFEKTAFSSYESLDIFLSIMRTKEKI